MRPFIQNLIQNNRFQDYAGIARGAYRVFDGFMANVHHYKMNDFDCEKLVKKQQESAQQAFDRFKEAYREDDVDPKQASPQQQSSATQDQNQQQQSSNTQTTSSSNKNNETQKEKSTEFKAKNQYSVMKKAKKTQNKPSYAMSKQPFSSKKEETKIDFDDIFESSPKFEVGKEQAVPSSQIARAYHFGMLGVSLAGSVVTQIVKENLGISKKKEGSSIKSYIFSEDNAEKIAETLCKMRGAPLKLGQVLSIQDDNLIPKAVRLAFEKARRSADIMPKTQLYAMLEQELGKNWKSKLQQFDDLPIAAASIGQVHRAKLLDGTEVAMKIQYPGVKESIDSDLNNLKNLMVYTNALPKTMFLDQLIHNTKLELMQECNYTIELEKQLKMRDLLISDRNYYVPKVYREFSSERIFTNEFIKGDTLDFASDNYPQELRNEIGRRIMKLTLREIFEWRYMQTDPNPANFFFSRKRNVLNLVDFGACHQYSTNFIDNYIEVIHAAQTKNRDQILEYSKHLGFLTGQENDIMKSAHVGTILTVGEPFQKNEEYDFGVQSITKKAYELIPVMLKHRLKAPPPEVYSLHRKFSGAFLLSTRLGAKYNCKELFDPLYEQYTKNKMNRESSKDPKSDAKQQ